MHLEPLLLILLSVLASGLFLWCVVALGASNKTDDELRAALLTLCEEIRAQQPILPPPTVDDYRRCFSAAPIGVWTDCIDEQIGLGFSGVSGKFSQTTFTDDGTGRWICEDEEIVFEWRTVGERTIEVRCVEHVPMVEGWTEEELEEDGRWHRLEYDFMIPDDVRQPVIYDVALAGNEVVSGDCNPQFLGCFGYRFGGPQKLYRC